MSLSERVRVGIVVASYLLSSSALARTEDDAEKALNSALDATMQLMERSLWQRASRWKCVPSSMFACSGKECAPQPALVWVVLDYISGTYARCDRGKCDNHRLASSSGGIYTIANATPESVLKALNDGSEYTEVVFTGTTSLVYHGRCTAVVD